MDADWQADLERWLDPFLKGWATRRGGECAQPILLD
jgi:hypothetical protein